MVAETVNNPDQGIDIFPSKNSPDDSNDSSPAGSPSDDKEQNRSAQLVRTAYDSIPIPLGILTLGIAPKLVDAADAYVVDPVVKGLVSKAKRSLFPYIQSLDDYYEAGTKKSTRKAKRKDKIEKSKRATSAEPHFTSDQCQQVLVSHSRRGSGDEPDGEPDCLTKSLQTPRGELIRPCNYMDMVQTGGAVPPQFGAVPSSYSPDSSTTIPSSYGFRSMNSTMSGGDSYYGGSVSSSTELVAQMVGGQGRGSTLQLREDVKKMQREIVKRELLDEFEYQPLFARDNRGWEFPLAKSEVNDRLSIKLTFENEKLRENEETRKSRANICDHRYSFAMGDMGEVPLRRSLEA